MITAAEKPVLFSSSRTTRGRRPTSRKGRVGCLLHLERTETEDLSRESSGHTQQGNSFSRSCVTSLRSVQSTSEFSSVMLKILLLGSYTVRPQPVSKLLHSSLCMNLTVHSGWRYSPRQLYCSAESHLPQVFASAIKVLSLSTKSHHHRCQGKWAGKQRWNFSSLSNDYCQASSAVPVQPLA